jgi:hypothetical protein
MSDTPSDTPLDNNKPIFDEDNDQLQSLQSLPEHLLADAMAQLNNPNKPLLAEEITETTTTTITTTTTTITAPDTEAPAVVHKHAWENDQDVAVNANGKNANRIICPFCLKSLILLPDAATHVKKTVFLPYPNAKNQTDGSEVDDFYKVNSKMDFENIEVKRPMGGDKFRYLTCADCGSGPLGITFDQDMNKIFYVSHDRVRFASKK